MGIEYVDLGRRLLKRYGVPRDVLFRPKPSTFGDIYERLILYLKDNKVQYDALEVWHSIQVETRQIVDPDEPTLEKTTRLSDVLSSL